MLLKIVDEPKLVREEEGNSSAAGGKIVANPGTIYRAPAGKRLARGGVEDLHDPKA